MPDAKEKPLETERPFCAGLTHCVHFAATKVDWVAATSAFTFCRVSRVARSSLLNTEAASPVPNWNNREFPQRRAVSPDGNVVSPIRPSSILAGRIRQSRRL